MTVRYLVLELGDSYSMSQEPHEEELFFGEEVMSSLLGI